MRPLRAPRHAGSVVLLGLAALGCATLEVVPAEHLGRQQLSPAAEPVAHIHASTWGIFLFKYIPIASGDLSRPGVPRWPRLFRNEVQLERLLATVAAASERCSGTLLTDLRSRDRSAWMSPTLVFWLNEIEVSANASRPLPPSDPDGASEPAEAVCPPTPGDTVSPVDARASDASLTRPPRGP